MDGPVQFSPPGFGPVQFSSERDMDICRPKDHKRWSRPSFCDLSGYEPKNMASWSTWQSLVHNSSGPWFEPRTCQNKNVVFSPRFEPRTLHNNKNQLPGCFLVLQHHFFLSLPRPSLEKRTVDARGVRGIWIYAAKRTTNHGRDHPFVVCHPWSV